MKRTFCMLWCVVLQIAIVTGQEAVSPYAGERDDAIKSLSKKQIESYLSGHGMGLAKAAELNHHPGPKHVLELAEKLQLTTEQKLETEQIYRKMHENAVRLGKQIVEAETRLNMKFAAKRYDKGSLLREVLHVSELHGKLRFVHLNAHLQMAALLSPEQINKYDMLRGLQVRSF